MEGEPGMKAAAFDMSVQIATPSETKKAAPGRRAFRRGRRALPPKSAWLDRNQAAGGVACCGPTQARGFAAARAGHTPCSPAGAMRIPTLIRAALACCVLLGTAGVNPCGAVTASWSPHSSGVPGHVWTRAGWIAIAHPRSELVPAKPRRRHSTPPYATNGRSAVANHCFGDQRTEHKSPSPDRAQASRTSLARLGTTAMPDRRARTAALAALAGIFHEAHAPPAPVATLRS
jgi:hypothetical protein